MNPGGKLESEPQAATVREILLGFLGFILNNTILIKGVVSNNTLSRQSQAKNF